MFSWIFYRRFIRGFSIIASPFTTVMKKETKKLRWNSAVDQAFKRLKAFRTIKNRVYQDSQENKLMPGTLGFVLCQVHIHHRKWWADSRLYPTPPKDTSEKCILPQLHFVGAIMWDIYCEIENTPELKIPKSCIAGKKYIPTHLCDTWAQSPWPPDTSALTRPTISSRASTAGPKCLEIFTDLSPHAPPVTKPKYLVPYPLENFSHYPHLRDHGHI